MVIDVNKIAKDLTREAYNPMRKNDTEERNKSWYDMVTTYAPNLSKNCKNFVSGKYEVPVSQLKIAETHYLMFRDELKNSNKFHYYVIYELPENKFVSVNCSGRIGFIERTYDLTDKAFHRAGNSLDEARRAQSAHMRAKYGKGYEDVKLRQGSIKTAGDIGSFIEEVSDAYELLKKTSMKNKKVVDNKIDSGLKKVLDGLEDIMSYASMI